MGAGTTMNIGKVRAGSGNIILSAYRVDILKFSKRPIF